MLDYFSAEACASNGLTKEKACCSDNTTTSNSCIGYQNVTEARLQELRNKHRPAVRASIEERSKGLQAWKDSKGLASKLYSFKHDPGSMIAAANRTDQGVITNMNGDASTLHADSAAVSQLYVGLTSDGEIDFVPDLKEQSAGTDSAVNLWLASPPYRDATSERLSEYEFQRTRINPLLKEQITYAQDQSAKYLRINSQNGQNGWKAELRNYCKLLIEDDSFWKMMDVELVPSHKVPPGSSIVVANCTLKPDEAKVAPANLHKEEFKKMTMHKAYKHTLTKLGVSLSVIDDRGGNLGI